MCRKFRKLMRMLHVANACDILQNQPHRFSLTSFRFTILLCMCHFVLKSASCSLANVDWSDLLVLLWFLQLFHFFFSIFSLNLFFPLVCCIFTWKIFHFGFWQFRVSNRLFVMQLRSEINFDLLAMAIFVYCFCCFYTRKWNRSTYILHYVVRLVALNTLEIHEMHTFLHLTRKRKKLEWAKERCKLSILDKANRSR